MASAPLSFSAQFVGKRSQTTEKSVLSDSAGFRKSVGVKASNAQFVGKRSQTTEKSVLSNSAGFRKSVGVKASNVTAERSRYHTVFVPSLYDVLGIQIGATSQEIKAAYRRLARISHPDAVSNDSSGEEFMRFHDAYSTLSDSEKRADYDRRLLRQQGMNRGSPVVMTSSGLRSSYRTPRSWETDQCW